MKKRRDRGKPKKFLKVVGLFVIVVIFIALLIFAVRFVSPFLKTNTDTGEIVRPIISSTTVAEIGKFLDDKGFVTDSIVESSASGSIMVKIRSGPVVYFSKTQSPDYQVSALRLIVQRLEVENKTPQTIDLRGKRPIVKF